MPTKPSTPLRSSIGSSAGRRPSETDRRALGPERDENTAPIEAVWTRADVWREVRPLQENCDRLRAELQEFRSAAASEEAAVADAQALKSELQDFRSTQNANEAAAVAAVGAQLEQISRLRQEADAGRQVRPLQETCDQLRAELEEFRSLAASEEAAVAEGRALRQELQTFRSVQGANELAAVSAVGAQLEQISRLRHEMVSARAVSEAEASEAAKAQDALAIEVAEAEATARALRQTRMEAAKESAAAYKGRAEGLQAVGLVKAAKTKLKEEEQAVESLRSKADEESKSGQLARNLVMEEADALRAETAQGAKVSEQALSLTAEVQTEVEIARERHEMISQLQRTLSSGSDVVAQLEDARAALETQEHQMSVVRGEMQDARSLSSEKAMELAAAHCISVAYSEWDAQQETVTADIEREQELVKTLRLEVVTERKQSACNLRLSELQREELVQEHLQVANLQSQCFSESQIATNERLRNTSQGHELLEAKASSDKAKAAHAEEAVVLASVRSELEGYTALAQRFRAELQEYEAKSAARGAVNVRDAWLSNVTRCAQCQESMAGGSFPQTQTACETVAETQELMFLRRRVKELQEVIATFRSNTSSAAPLRDLQRIPDERLLAGSSSIAAEVGPSRCLPPLPALPRRKAPITCEEPPPGSPTAVAGLTAFSRIRRSGSMVASPRGEHGDAPVLHASGSISSPASGQAPPNSSLKARSESKASIKSRSESGRVASRASLALTSPRTSS